MKININVPEGLTFRDAEFLEELLDERGFFSSAAIVRAVAEEIAYLENIYGPQTKHVEKLIEKFDSLNDKELETLKGRHADWGVAQEALWDAAVTHDRSDEMDAACHKVKDRKDVSIVSEVCALVMRDVILPKHYNTLTRVWRTFIGPILPDDEVLV